MPTPDKPPQRKRKVAGLEITDEDWKRLTDKLDEIEKAERRAWVDMGLVWIQ
jgi:hypothetical protein